MPALASFGGRGRLAAVSCAAICTGVVVRWHLHARRRAPDSQRASLFVSGLNALPCTTSDEDCDAPEELAAEFQEATRRASQPDVPCSDEQRLQLYALYKQATTGACAAPPPSRLDFVAHAKWRSWQQLGALTKQNAMTAYILLAGELTGQQMTKLPQSNTRSSASLGPVQSTLASIACSPHDVDVHAPVSMLACTKAGDVHCVAVLLSKGESPDATRDAFGRTPLLWAADGGSAVLVALLLAAGAHVEAQDEDGSTPLLHATLCGHEHAARALLAAGADACARDSDGCCAADVRPAEWSTWFPEVLASAAKIGRR